MSSAAHDLASFAEAHPVLFLSHSGTDAEAAKRLAECIETTPEAPAAKRKVWLDKDHLQSGRGWQEILLASDLLRIVAMPEAATTQAAVMGQAADGNPFSVSNSESKSRSKERSMRIFICHASEQHSLAARLATALREHAHKVFLDKDDLPPGASFDVRIRQAIGRSHLLIFLIAPQALEKNAYTLSELKFARERWPNPADHVLPVMVVDTPFDNIPAYLSNLTILQPEGNLVAEILAETDRIRRGRWFRQAYVVGSSTIAVSFTLFLGVYTLGTERIVAILPSISVNHELRSDPRLYLDLSFESLYSTVIFLTVRGIHRVLVLTMSTKS